MSSEASFRYLNQDNAWPDLKERHGVVIEGGALQLGPVPGDPQPVGSALMEPPELAGPLGIGADAEGNLYVADPARHQIIKIGCDGQGRPFACLGGPGSEPGRLRAPRGVLVGPRAGLYVADSGNHRVQIFDLHSGQLRAVWGQPDLWAEPTPSDTPGRFRSPLDLAADRQGRLYVVEPGEPAGEALRPGRVQRFDADGQVDPSFWAAVVAQAQVPQAPVAIAAVLLDPVDPLSERLLVIDSRPWRLLVYSTDGSYDAATANKWAPALIKLAQPVAAAYSQGRLFIADAAHRQVSIFGQDGVFIGVAQGYRGRIAGLALDQLGRLVVPSRSMRGQRAGIGCVPWPIRCRPGPTFGSTPT
jgi:sugar lactone lactonase YvrE